MPIIVAGCKLDLRGDQHATSLEEVMGPIMQQFREIETCVECSATTMIQVHQVAFTFCFLDFVCCHKLCIWTVNRYQFSSGVLVLSLLVHL